MITTEFLCKVEVTLEPARELGDTPLGRRRIIGITGGKFAGHQWDMRSYFVHVFRIR